MRIDTLMNSPRYFLCDGGLETYMIFEKRFDLPCFSATVLLDSNEGRAALRAYYERYIKIARISNRGYLLDAPTWRAGVAWAEPMGFTRDQILASNTNAVNFVKSICDEHDSPQTPILVNGLVGPAGDAYASDMVFTVNQARDLHQPQIHQLGKAGVDMISALTMTNVGEATGIALAAREIDLPVVISFTVETDGRLLTGQLLRDAIEEVDDLSGAAPKFYMINCAHPDHFRDVLKGDAEWLQRIGGIRSNASRMSHEELDNAEELDAGDPVELGQLTDEIRSMLTNVRVVGGCCGTDHRHISCMAGQ